MEREKLAILTKVWWRYDGPEDQTSRPERQQMAKSTIERFRHELDTDYIDIVLLHCLDHSRLGRAHGALHGGAGRREIKRTNQSARLFMPRFSSACKPPRSRRGST